VEQYEIELESLQKMNEVIETSEKLNKENNEVKSSFYKKNY
jgi:hypothetical protein